MGKIISYIVLRVFDLTEEFSAILAQSVRDEQNYAYRGILKHNAHFLGSQYTHQATEEDTNILMRASVKTNTMIIPHPWNWPPSFIPQYRARHTMTRKAPPKPDRLVASYADHSPGAVLQVHFVPMTKTAGSHFAPLSIISICFHKDLGVTPIEYSLN